MEPVYGARMIKKILSVKDPRCDEAFVVVYFFHHIVGVHKEQPLLVSVNGHKTSCPLLNTEQYLYIPIEPSWLKKGKNEIIFSCPDAKNADDGWPILIARRDEYKAGGWDPEKNRPS